MKDRVLIADLRGEVDKLFQINPSRWTPAQVQEAKAVAFDLARFATYFRDRSTTDGRWTYETLTKLQFVLNNVQPVAPAGRH